MEFVNFAISILLLIAPMGDAKPQADQPAVQPPPGNPNVSAKVELGRDNITHERPQR